VAKNISPALDVINKYPELGWVKGNTELLNLGPAAMDILAQTHLRKETFKSLNDAGFSAKGSVGIASMLHEHGSKDVNKDAQTLADNVKSLNDPAFKAAIDARAKLQVPAPNETPAQAEARRAQIPAAEDQVRATAAAHIAKKPQDAVKVKGVTDAVGIELKKNEATTNLRSKVSNATADKNAAADALLAELGESKPAAATGKAEDKAHQKADHGGSDHSKPKAKKTFS